MDTAVALVLAARLLEWLCEAARELAPSEHLDELWAIPRAAVVANEASASAGDYICRAPSVLWGRLLAKQRGRGPVRVVVTSAYGIMREREYSSAGAIGEALLSALPDGARQTIADARTRRDGCLVLTTRVHLCRQHASGLVQCTACGDFFSGAHGLREHWNFKHKTSYECARTSAATACKAIVPYGRFAVDEVVLLRIGTARAEMAAKLAAELPAGLAAARDGDLGTLEALLVAGWKPQTAADRHGSSALIWAAAGGHLAACELLHAHGASVTYQQPNAGKGGSAKDAAAVLEDSSAFGEVGLDSLDVLQLVRTLNARLHPHVTLADDAVFEHPTVHELARHMHSMVTARLCESSQSSTCAHRESWEEMKRVAEVDQEAQEAQEAPAETDVEPSCERLSTIQTTDYHLWPHGFAVTATLYHSRAALQMLQQSPRLSLSELCALAGAHPGHLAAMLRTLCAVGWVTRDDHGSYSTTATVAQVANASALAELCTDVYGVAGGQDSVSEPGAPWGGENWRPRRRLPHLAKWLKTLQSEGWTWCGGAATAHLPLLAKMLAGAVLAPLLLGLRLMQADEAVVDGDGAGHVLGGDATSDHSHDSPLLAPALLSVSLQSMTAETAASIGSFFAAQAWGAYDSSAQRISLSDAGSFVLQRSAAFGVCVSYRALLQRLGEATFGETAAVFQREGEHELWVDRQLNVLGSGFMHRRYFDDLIRVHIRPIFDAEPMAAQPRLIVDVGCGDGTLLRAIYLFIKSHTRRGQHLDAFPLTVVGADLSAAALGATAHTLTTAHVPHTTMACDLGSPAPLQAALEDRFQVHRDDVLHVRSFVDHEMPYVVTVPAPSATAAAIAAQADTCHVDTASGRLITPAEAFQCLTEHFERWAACLGTHGLLVLEVHCLDIASTQRYINEATALHFDCLQSHSGQLLVPAAHFALATAAAGLLPALLRPADSRAGQGSRAGAGVLTYPKDSPYTRIVLQRLRPANVRVRLATTADLDELLELEGCWGSEGLAASEATLRERLALDPYGRASYVAESISGRLLGALYTQRIGTYESLLTTTREAELALHEPHGCALHLLGVVQRPEAAVLEDGRSVGKALRDFVCHVARLEPALELVCGVTRCRGFDGRLPYAEHVANMNDPGLLFHSQAGAIIGDLVPGYRPSDRLNCGYGVLVLYNLGKGKRGGSRGALSTDPNAAAIDTVAAAKVVKTSLALSLTSPPTLPLPPTLQSQRLPISEPQCREWVREAVASLRYSQPPTASQPASRFGGRTALHWAARYGHLSVCQWLVRHGADVDAQMADGTPPLHWAVWQGRLAVCKWLVDDAGANLHALNTFGCNAFQWAAQSPSTYAVDVCRWLRGCGLNAAVLNCNGHSAVHKAAIKGNRAVCEWLLSAEGGLSTAHLLADRDGNTPASMARAEGFVELADWLDGVSAGHAHPHASESEGRASPSAQTGPY